MESSYVIKWSKETANTYNYGSKINFLKNSVRFSNPQMSPGGKIHQWFSKTNYLEQVTTVNLPLLKSDREYRFVAELTCEPQNSVHILIEFFDESDELIDNPIFTELTDTFTVPHGTRRYELSLVNLNNKALEFHYLIISPVASDPQISVFDDDFKMITIEKQGEKNENKILLIIRNRVLDAGTYFDEENAKKIYIEYNGFLDWNSEKIASMAKQIVKQVEDQGVPKIQIKTIGEKSKDMTDLVNLLRNRMNLEDE